MKRRVAVLLAVVVATALGACSKDDKKDAAKPSSDETTTTAVVRNEAAEALEGKLIKNVPAGYTQEDDSVADTGPSDLEKAIRDDGDDDAREALTDAKFVAGYQRYWTHSADDTIVAFLYEFGDAAGAQAFHDRVTADLGQSDESVTYTPFDLSGIPNAKAYTAKTADGNAALVSFVRGKYAAQVIVNGADANAETTTTLANEAYANLG